MTKLTDTQLIILSKAAQRDDGAAAVPESMKGAAAAKVAASLIARKLMREVRQKPGMPVWRKDEDDRCYSLVLLRAGREAIGVEEDAAGEAEAPKPAASKGSGRKNGAAKARGTEQDAGKIGVRLPRAESKQSIVIDMLSGSKGATLEALVDATGWLPHTTRAVLTGLRKRGFEIDRTRDEKRGSVYRIVSQKTA